MELRHLRSAVAVADHLHFGRAAAALGIAQPPLSQSIKALETELGVPLFERDTRNVRLTAAGEAFVAEARTALALVDSAGRKARAAGRGEAGDLAIGMVGSSVQHPLPLIIRQFRARYPDVRLTFSVLPTTVQVEQLRTAVLDVGLLRPPLPGPADDLEQVPISREPLVAVLPSDHRLARREYVHVRSLAGEPFVLFPRALGPGLYDEITALCRRGEFVPDVAQEAVQLQTIVGLVAAGCGVSIVPRSAALERPEVAFVSLRPTTRPVDLALAMPVAGRSVVASNFAALARDLIRARRARSSRAVRRG